MSTDCKSSRSEWCSLVEPRHGREKELHTDSQCDLGIGNRMRIQISRWRLLQLYLGELLPACSWGWGRGVGPTTIRGAEERR